VTSTRSHAVTPPPPPPLHIIIVVVAVVVITIIIIIITSLFLHLIPFNLHTWDFPQTTGLTDWVTVGKLVRQPTQ